MNVKVLTEYHLEFLNLKGGCTGSSKSTLIKMPQCWKSHTTAHLYVNNLVGDVNAIFCISIMATEQDVQGIWSESGADQSDNILLL